MQKGFVKIPRDIFSSDIWDEKRVYSRFEALTDLYQLADYRSRRLTVSFRALADRWSWCLAKVQRFIKVLSDEGYIRISKEDNITVFTVVDTLSDTPNDTPNDTPKSPEIKGFQEVGDTPNDTPTDTLTDTPRAYKNDNIISCLIEEKKEEPPISPKGETEKKKRSVFRKPTVEEIRDYINEKGYRLDAQKIFDHYEMVGWVYGKGHNPIKDWKAAVRTWNNNQSQRQSLPIGFTLKDNSTAKYDNDKIKQW